MSEEWDDSLANQTPEEFTQRCALELSRFSGQVKIKQKGVELAKTQTPYPDEFRRRMVELLGLHRTRDKLNTRRRHSGIEYHSPKE